MSAAARAGRRETYEVYKWNAEAHPEEVNVYATNGASSHAPASRKHRLEIFIGLLPAADDAALTLAPDLTVDDRVHVEFLQAIPLFDSELALKKEEGAETLLEQWRAGGVPFWNPSRTRFR